MEHIVIVPGVGDSDHAHWQSWLQHQYANCSRVEQQDWQSPQLAAWQAQLLAHIDRIDQNIIIVAHSFGCLTSIATLKQYPELQNKVQQLLLVAPANPERFNEQGFNHQSERSIAAFVTAPKLKLNSVLIASENDPWLTIENATYWADQWQSKLINMGQAGHINTESGYGPWPELLQILNSNFAMSSS